MATKTDKLWNKDYIKVMTANFTLNFSFYILTPLLPLYLSEHFHATKDIIGLVLSGYTLTALLFRPFSGYVVDSFPRKKVLLLALFIYALFFGSYIMASSLLLFTVVRTLHGAPFGASTVANSTMAIDVLPSARRNEGIGLYGLSNNLATAIAPSVGVLTYRYTHNFTILFYIALALALIGFAVNTTIQPHQKQVMKDRKAISLDRFLLLRGWMIGMNIAFFGMCYGVLSNYLAIYGKETMGITGGTGIFFMLLSIGLIISRLQGTKALREGRLIGNAEQGIIISTVGYGLFVTCPHSIGYYTSALLIGLGNGHLWPAFQNMIINMAYNNERGTANSTLLTAWDIGIGAGILLGGVAAEWWGYVWAFALVAVVHVAGAIFFFSYTRLAYEKRKIR